MTGISPRSALLERLVSDGPELSERVLADMYVDPFWQARFGDRGRRHSKNDGDFHLKYLGEALVADDASLFDSYASWLREVLSSRGMCSRHLAENFTRLADAIDGEGWPDSQPAIAILQRGAHSLTYTTGPASAVEAVRAGTEARVDTLLSYLADALVAAQPSRFASYAAVAVAVYPDHARAVAEVRALVAHIPEASIIVRGVS